MKKLILILLFSLASDLCFSQILNYGLHEFQYSAFNPSMVSLEERLSLSYLHRTQNYISELSIRTTGISLWNPFRKKSGKKWGGLGLSYLGSNSNIDNYISQQTIQGQIAYNFDLKNAGEITIALQPGYHHWKTSASTFSTGSQYNPITGFDPSVSNGENSFDERSSFFSLDAGILWKLERIGFVGLSIYNLNKPNASFSSLRSGTQPTFSLQGGVAGLRRSKVSIDPLILLRIHNHQADYSIGAEMKYNFRNLNPFDPLQSGRLKVISYLNDQATFKWGIIFEQPAYSVGLSYETSSLTKKNTVLRPAFEFAIKLKLKKQKAEAISMEVSSPAEVRQFFVEKGDLELTKDIPDTTNLTIKKIENLNFVLKRDFHFGFNEFVLNEEAMEFLNEIVVLLEENQRLHLKAIGHTDDVGSKRGNNLVSLRRAEAAIDYLISKGIDAKRMRAEGKGDSEPLLPNNSEENRSRNRRVELILYFQRD